MTRRGLWWRVAAVVFALGNAASVVYHIAIGEMGPASVHAVLAVGTLVFWRSVFNRQSEPENADGPRQIDSHLDHLQQSVDSIALEVERLGEGQRFAQKILERRLADRPRE